MIKHSCLCFKWYRQYMSYLLNLFHCHLVPHTTELYPFQFVNFFFVLWQVWSVALVVGCVVTSGAC